ncbi:hypothetical protein NFI96_024187, partial [Prochilodus magdalenae]
DLHADDTEFRVRPMRYTFKSDDCMVITIPLQNIRNTRDGQLMPEKFTCVFKDMYKVFLKGRPKALGSAQITTGVFILCLGALFISYYGSLHAVHIVPSTLFIACGILSCAAGHSPLMPVMKMSFIFNIVGLFWAIAALAVCPLLHDLNHKQLEKHDMYIGLKGVLVALHALQFILAAVLIYWESKAICRTHFNTLVTYNPLLYISTRPDQNTAHDHAEAGPVSRPRRHTEPWTEEIRQFHRKTLQISLALDIA